MSQKKNVSTNHFISMDLVWKKTGKFKILLKMCNVPQDYILAHNYFTHFIIGILYLSLYDKVVFKQYSKITFILKIHGMVTFFF